MPRIARVVGRVLALAVLPAALLGQTGASPSTSAPVLERRAMTPAPTASTGTDPWLASYVGLGGSIGRANLVQLDQALQPYGAPYSKLAAGDRARVRQAFDDVLRAQQFTRYRLSAPQARAIVYLALGPVERGGSDCDGPRRRSGGRCGQALDSMSRHSAWIHSTILAMGRSGNRRPRAEELGALRAMHEHAREMVVGASGCGCPTARTDAEALLAATREAVDDYEGSASPAWMSLGDQRVQRIARLSDSLERTFLRCLGDG